MEPELASDLFDSLGLEALLPATLAAWRPLLAEGMAFFLEHLPEARLGAIVAEQFALAAAAPAAERITALLAHCPTLHKLGQVVARQPGLDAELLLQVAAGHEALVTLEEGAVMGGAGSAVAEALAAAGVVKPLLQLGLPDEFIEHGDPARLLSLQGLDAAGIEASVRQRFGELASAASPALKIVA